MSFGYFSETKEMISLAQEYLIAIVFFHIYNV